MALFHQNTVVGMTDCWYRFFDFCFPVIILERHPMQTCLHQASISMSKHDNNAFRHGFIFALRDAMFILDLHLTFKKEKGAFFMKMVNVYAETIEKRHYENIPSMTYASPSRTNKVISSSPCSSFFDDGDFLLRLILTGRQSQPDKTTAQMTVSLVCYRSANLLNHFRFPSR